MVCPVMCAAPGEARKQAVSAMSPVVPGRLSWVEAWLVGGLPEDGRALLAGLLEKLTADVGRRVSGESPGQRGRSSPRSRSERR
jgi:hypothetical protein